MLVSMYQITWCHIPNSDILVVTSVRTSNIIVVSVTNNIIPPFLYYSKQEEHEKYIVCFLLGYSPASEFYVPTFRNTLSVPSS